MRSRCATWLLTEYYPEDGRFFGLCDLGMGSPELGYVNSEEIEQSVYSRRPPIVERDLYFRARIRFPSTPGRPAASTVSPRAPPIWKRRKEWTNEGHRARNAAGLGRQRRRFHF